MYRHKSFTRLKIFFILIALIVVSGAYAAAPVPTVSIINPKPGTSTSPTIVSLSGADTFKAQVQVYDDLAITADSVKVGYYTGTTPDTGTFTFVTAKLNSNYNCGGTKCGIYDATMTGLAAGTNYYLYAKADSADGTGESRQERTGNDARYVYISVKAKKTGTGNLAPRDESSQLCSDCHNLKSHSSQTTDTGYKNWQTTCLECHIPHNTTNIFLIKNTIITPNSGSKAVVLWNTTGDGDNSYVDSTPPGGTPNGVCQVCHTQTTGNDTIRWRNTGNSDTHYTAAKGTKRCTVCHVHTGGFQPSCIGCHSIARGTRTAVVGEFGLAWGHHDNTVTNADCAVCHMEATSVADPSRSDSHAGVADGVIDLRDPDLGTAIASGASVFARDLSSNTLETFALSIQNNHCLKCHDGDGANYLGDGQKGADGSHTPANPFATGVAPVNVNVAFTTSNASFHPVKGVQNNAFCDVDTMEAPWNVPNGTHKQITCFDCHAAKDATGKQSRTVVAHGNAVTLRKPYDRVAQQATKLCVVCHKTTVYWTGASATGSAFETSATTSDTETHPNTAGTTSRHVVGETYFNGCIACHSSAGSNAAQPARPRAAEDTHGYNTLVGGGNWATITPATAGAPPYAFMRATNALTSWRPKAWPGQSAPTAGSCNGTTMCGRGESTYAYQPGGAY